MGETAEDRDRAYLNLLHRGLVMVRNFASGGEVELCRIEAEHLHEIPTLIGEANENRHVYYIVQTRGMYIERLRELNATMYLEDVTIWYSRPWKVLAHAAGVTLAE